MPPHSPRSQEDRHPAHPGSSNPSLRKKARPTDSENADHDALEIATDNAPNMPPPSKPLCNAVGGQAIKDESQNLMALLQAAQDLYLGMAECKKI